MFFRQQIRHCRFILAILTLGSAGSFVSAYVLPLGTYPKIEINGNNTLSLNLHQVDGSRSFYGDDNADKDQTITNSSNLYITGELYKDLFLNATVAADRYSPDQYNWNMRYDGKDARLLLGEFNANLTGNEYAQLNRSLEGLKVDVMLPRGTLSLIGSDLQAPVRTDAFYGQNISGPYYLTSSPIVDGSEVVTVNNLERKRTTDYTIDYNNGVLYFTAGTIISPADQVIVSYEVQANGLGGGRLYAVRATYPLSNSVIIGATQLLLDGQNRGDKERDERDQYLGNGTPGPFYLSSRPIIAGTEVVTINGVLVPALTDTGENTYTLDYQTGQLLFRQGYEPPVGSTLIVRYRVAISGAGSADRAVTGVDVDWALKNGLRFNVQAAQSKGAGEAGAGNTAMAIGANYNTERLNASVRFRDIGSGFSPLETVGYRNIDKDLQWSLQYSPMKDLTLSTNGNSTRLPLNPYLSNGSSSPLMNELNHFFTIDYHKKDWPRIVYQHITQDTSQVGIGSLKNGAATDSLNVTITREHLNGTLSLNRVNTDSNQLTDINNPESQLFDYHGATDNAALNLQYQPNDRFNMGVNLAANRIEANSSNGDTSTSGRNAQVNASYKASNNLSFTTELSMNQTGSAQSVTGGSINPLRDQNLTFITTWQPFRNVDVNMNLTKSRTEGDLYSNSDADSLTTNVGWRINDMLNINGYWSRQNLTYLESPGGSVSNMVGMNTEIRPLGKLRLNLDAQYLWGETSTAVTQMLASQASAMRTVLTAVADQYGLTSTGNRLTMLAAQVNYPITEKQEVFVKADTTQSSGFPSKSIKNSIGLGWNYRLNDNLIFTLDAGRVQYSDEANKSLNYGANQLNAQFSWNF